MYNSVYDTIETLIEEVETLFADSSKRLTRAEIIELTKVAVLQEVLGELRNIKQSIDDIYSSV